MSGNMMNIDLSDKVLKKKTEIYMNQITRTLERLTKVLDTKDQDYINSYVLKVLETSFHRGYLPQKDISLVAEILNKKIKYDRKSKDEKVKKNRDWLYALEHLINFKIDYCVICGNKLHNQGKFPKGYPDEWKLCCAHRDALLAGFDNANANTGLAHIGDFNTYKEKFEELFTIQ